MNLIPIYHPAPNNRITAFWQALQDAMAVMRFTGLPWLTFVHDSKWYEVKLSGEWNRICGARKKDGLRCRSKSLHKGGKCKFHGGLSTGAKTPEGKARAIAAMRAGWVRWQAERGTLC